ncbi:MAG: hypothetical protein ACOYIB_08035 [Desulfosporosinus sp.]
MRRIGNGSWTTLNDERSNLVHMVQLRYKTGKKGVPILKNTDIDTDAELLLRNYNPVKLLGRMGWGRRCN